MIIQPDWLVASSEEVSANTAVRVLDGVITHVAPPGELVSLFPEDEIVDGSGCALLPGFVNSHVHLYGTLAHGIVIESPPTGFESFLDDYWWPQVEDRLDQQMIGAATEWVCAEICYEVAPRPFLISVRPRGRCQVFSRSKPSREACRHARHI